MTSPNSGEWNRAEEILDALEGMSREEARADLQRRREKGESEAVLRLVEVWRELPPPPPSIHAGDWIAGRYQLKEVLGEGGMGAVWRAQQSLIEREVAVKIIPPMMVAPALRGRFVQEMAILGQLRHPGIVRILDAGLHMHNGTEVPFFAMELVEGETLADWAEGHREDRAQLLRMMAEVCMALQHAHDRKIVHRDLKPTNIMVQPNGQAVVFDFGVARLAGGGPDEPGEFSGTPQYAAPEQHLGRDRDFRSGESVDVYAMGAIVFEVLTGQRLFSWGEKRSMAELRDAIVEGEAPRLREVLPGCPPVLDELVARAIRRDPADRYYSISAMSRALERVAGLLAGPVKPAPPPWAPTAGLKIPGTEWRLTGKMGEGAAGQVWAGVHEQLGEKRVFKFCGSEEKIRTLKRELTLFRLLKERVGQNPHFIRIHEVSLEEPPWYLMMEHVEGEDLEQWCQHQPGGLAELSVEVKVGIVAQVAEALQVAHEAGILHRDIKPGNLLVGTGEAPPEGSTAGPGEPHVYVADFGIGQIISDELLREGTRMGFTRTISEMPAALSGTLLYMAPEVMEGGAATARSDLYSLGVVCWQMVAGDFGKALKDWRHHVSDALLREDLEKCLAGSPENRWPSAGALAASLRALPERRAAEAKRQVEIAARERAAYRRGVLRTALVAVVVVVGLAGLAWYAWRKSEEAETQRRAAAAGRARATLGELRGLHTLRSAEARRRLFQEMPTLEFEGAGLRSDLRNMAVAILAQPAFETLADYPIRLRGEDCIAEFGDRLMIKNPGTGLPEVANIAIPSPWKQLLPRGEAGMTRFQINARGRVAGAISREGLLHIWNQVDQFGKEAISHQVVEGRVHAECFAIAPTTLAKSRQTPVAVARPDGSVEVLLAGESNVRPAPLVRRSTPTLDAFPESSPVTRMAFSTDPEGVLAVAGAESNLLMFWQLNDENAKSLAGEFVGAAWHPDRIQCLGWCPGRPEIASGAEDGVLRIWRYAASGTIPQMQPVRAAVLGEPIREVVWSADGELIGVLLKSGETRILAAQTPSLSLVDAFETQARRIGFLGSNVLACWSEEKCEMKGIREAGFAQRMGASRDAAVCFHRSGTLTVSGPEGISFFVPATLAWSGGVKLSSSLPAMWAGDRLLFHNNQAWQRGRTTMHQSPQRIQIHHDGEFSRTGMCVGSPLGRRWVIYRDQALQCYDEQGVEKGTVTAQCEEPSMLTVSDAEAMTAWVSKDRLTVQHHRADWRKTCEVEGILSLAFSPEGRWLVCRTRTGVSFVSLEAIGKGGRWCAMPAPGNGRSPVAISPDGRWLAVCGSNHEVVLGEMPDEGAGAMEKQIEEVFKDPIVLQSPYPKRIGTLGWNAKGSRLACGTSDGYVQMWNLSLLRETLRLWNLDRARVPIAPEPECHPITLN